MPSTPPVRTNYWTEHAAMLTEAYARSAGTVRFELVTRCLLAMMSEGPCRVVDVGGGYGRQAVLLARAGHSVVIVDVDPKMLDLAREFASGEQADVRERLDFVLGDGNEAVNLVGTGFDLVCCHSVLMYEDDPSPLLRTLVDLARPGGLLSLLSLNPHANAMRSGLQGRWRETVATLQIGMQADPLYVRCREHSREDVSRILEASGVQVLGWHGVGVFTDHLTESIVVDDPAQVILAEWLAGNKDPYRQVARCYHLLAAKP